LLRAGDGLRGADGVGSALARAVAAVDRAGAAAADVVDVQVAAGGEHLEGVGAVGVGDGDRAVVRGCAGAVHDRRAARAGHAGMDAGEGPGRGAGGRVERDRIHVPGQGAGRHREGQVQRAGAASEADRDDRADGGARQPAVSNLRSDGGTDRLPR